MQTITLTTRASKQRKMVHQAPDHRRSKLFAAPLSPELKASQGLKTLSVRSGDTVRVMRGDHKGFEGKVTRVDRARYRVYVEGLTREKVDGTATSVPTHPSKVMITNLNLDDKWRKQVLERKRAAQRKMKKVSEKHPKKLPKEVVEAREKAVEEKPVEKPPKRERRRVRRKTVKEPVARKAEKEAKEGEKEKRPKAKKPKPKRRTAKKAQGER